MSVPDDAYDLKRARVIKATDRALLVTAPELPEHPVFGNREKWIPRSVVHEDSEVYDAGHEGTLLIFTWWAEKESLL